MSDHAKHRYFTQFQDCPLCLLEAENERLSQRLTDVREALQAAREQLTNWYRMWDDGRDYATDPPGDDAVLQECAATEGVISTIDDVLPRDWKAIQKKVQETAKKAREASSG